MFRLYTISNQLRLPSAKTQHARRLSVLKPDSRLRRRMSLRTRKIFHTKTFESLFSILDSRLAFVSPWKNHDDNCGNCALMAPDGLIYPGTKWVQFGRKRRDTYYTRGMLILQRPK